MSSKQCLTALYQRSTPPLRDCCLNLRIIDLQPGKQGRGCNPAPNSAPFAILELQPVKQGPAAKRL